MPIVFPASGFGRNYQQMDKAGVTVTASATPHTMGAWATLVDPLSYDLFGLFLQAWGVGASATDTRQLLDVGISPSGGGNEQVVIPYLDTGASPTSTSAGPEGKAWFFPLYVPSGKAVRARVQGVIVSDTVVVRANFFELPPHGFAEDSPQEWAQYGADGASSQGVAVTSGNAAFGTEAQVTAATARAHRWWHVSLGLGTNTAITAGRYRVRLARDTGAADVIGVWDFSITASEEVFGPFPSVPVCYPVSAGEPLYVDIDGGGAEALTVVVYAY